MNKVLKGRCLCGLARYQVEDAFTYALICHCSQCRRATGAGHKPFAGIERSKLSPTSDSQAYRSFGGSDTHDVRCATCGSLLYSIVREARYAHVTLGTLVDEPTIRPTAHIHVASKASWDVILDELPQHDVWP